MPLTLLVALLAPGLGARAAGESLPLVEACDAAALPLDVRLAPGWTPEERGRISALLCDMLPVLGDLYGDPFERLPVTLVKDPQAAGGWSFSPAKLEVRCDGSWDPQLLTHELVHAFRGRRVLTRTIAGRVLPELLGFEEGFAEAVADLALNEYVRRRCPGGDCPGGLLPSRSFWTSSLEWTYDFANDASLRTGNLWSDGGGTGKARERYQMAAAAILRLEVAAPGFSRRFNQAYYARLRSEQGFEPSREAVLEILESLLPEIDGLPARAWVARQHVLQGPPAAGARDWIVDETPGSGVGASSHLLLHFVETFADGWDAGVANAAGILGLSPAFEPGPERLFPVVMQRPAGAGFPFEELVLAADPGECRGLRLAEPVCIPQPESFGLYLLETRWLAPGPGRPGTRTPGEVTTSYPRLAGEAPADFDPQRHLFVGGILGAGSGQLVITHSRRPGELRAAVRNGAFYAEVPSCRRQGDDCWVEPYAAWSDQLVSVPGTLSFHFTGDDGRVLDEQRSIVFGRQPGRHRFLLGAR
jgi:hypothetical protein